MVMLDTHLPAVHINPWEQGRCQVDGCFLTKWEQPACGHCGATYQRVDWLGY